MRWSAGLKLVIVLGVCSCAGAEPKTWDYAGGGRWPLVDTPTTKAAIIPNATLDLAERYLAAGDPDKAHDILADWVKNNPHADDRDRAIFLLGEMDYQQGDRLKAFYQLDELLEKYPESRFFYPALEKQFAVADAFLKGYKRKVLGIPLLGAEDEAVDMLYRIQERSPGSPLAERAMLTTADYYYNSGDFDLAGDVYTAYLRSYPRSPEVPRVQLRRAFSAYAQFRGTRHESTPLIEARTQLEDIKVKYPELAAEANVQKFIDSVNETLARKLVVSADFYRRTGHPGATVYTLREVLENYPNSAAAETARQQLKTMPAAALAQAAPPSGQVELPTTAPSHGGIADPSLSGPKR
jgi:outer membrane assembly lipoprotein YfiO